MLLRKTQDVLRWHEEFGGILWEDLCRCLGIHDNAAQKTQLWHTMQNSPIVRQCPATKHFLPDRKFLNIPPEDIWGRLWDFWLLPFKTSPEETLGDTAEAEAQFWVCEPWLSSGSVNLGEGLQQYRYTRANEDPDDSLEWEDVPVVQGNPPPSGLHRTQNPLEDDVPCRDDLHQDALKELEHMANSMCPSVVFIRDIDQKEYAHALRKVDFATIPDGLDMWRKAMSNTELK
jgi:hypothetical protein